MMFDKGLKRVAAVYVALQLVLWAKCALFFSWFGFGKSMPFNYTLFPQEALQFDFFFHNGVHVAIGLLALLFGARMRRLEPLKLVAVVFAAVALHNAAYWFTATHQSIAYSAFDFARDSALLFAAVAAGFAAKKAYAALENKGLCCRKGSRGAGKQGALL